MILGKIVTLGKVLTLGKMVALGEIMTVRKIGILLGKSQSWENSLGKKKVLGNSDSWKIVTCGEIVRHSSRF